MSAVPGTDGPFARAGDGFSVSAEEAARLVDALGEWLASRAGVLGNLGGLSGLGSHLAGPECRVCPVCQLIAGLRQSRPEIVEHLDAAAGSLLAAARLMLDGAEARRGGRRPPGFEHIDIG